MAKKNKQAIASPVKSQRGLEVAYRKQLNKLGKALLKSIRIELLPFLKSQQPTYVADSAPVDLSYIQDHFEGSEYILDDSYIRYRDTILFESRKHLSDGIGSQLGVIFRRINSQFSGTAMASFAEFTASEAVEKTARVNKQKFDRSVHRATGVDFGAVVSGEGLDDFVELSVNKNVSLIKSLPEEYLTQIETIVNNGVVSGARYRTIEKEIIGKTGANSKLNNRIKTIARNEIQTINSQITLRRSEKLGIKEGIFRTSQDEKVRKCHKELNGERYEIAKGAWSKTCQKFIQPGITDINCRCSYSPIIEVDKPEIKKSEKPIVKKPIVKKPIETTIKPEPREIKTTNIKKVNSIKAAEHDFFKKMGDGDTPFSRSHGGHNPIFFIGEEKGFNKKPQQLSSKQFDKELKKSASGILYRGVSKQEFRDQFIKGENFTGVGIYGRGSYFGAGKKAFEKAEQFSHEIKPIKAAMKPSAKIVKYSDLIKEQKKFLADLEADLSFSNISKKIDSGEITQKKANQLLNSGGAAKRELQDEGVFATFRGYDAIWVDLSSGKIPYKSYAIDVGADEMIVLNRGKVMVDTGE